VKDRRFSCRNVGRAQLEKDDLRVVVYRLVLPMGRSNTYSHSAIGTQPVRVNWGIGTDGVTAQWKARTSWRQKVSRAKLTQRPEAAVGAREESLRDVGQDGFFFLFFPAAVWRTSHEGRRLTLLMSLVCRSQVRFGRGIRLKVGKRSSIPMTGRGSARLAEASKKGRARVEAGGSAGQDGDEYAGGLFERTSAIEPGKSSAVMDRLSTSRIASRDEQSFREKRGEVELRL